MQTFYRVRALVSALVRMVCAVLSVTVVAAPARSADVAVPLALAVPEHHAEQRIAIKRCEPSRSVTTTPAYGFTPAFYPRGRYYWDDVYGFPYYQRPVAVNESGTLAIDYVNVTPTVMRSIEFGLIANGRLVAEVRDVGTFSPNVEIKHQFGLNPNVFPLSTALARCVPLRITYADQATWVNPRLPALRRQIYGGAP